MSSTTANAGSSSQSTNPNAGHAVQEAATGMTEITQKNFHPRLKVYPIGVNMVESYRKHAKLPAIRKSGETCAIFSMTWSQVLLAWLFTAITSWELLFINSIFSHESILMLSDSQQEPTNKVKRKLEAFLAFRGLTLSGLVPINPIPHWISFMKDGSNQYIFFCKQRAT